MGRQTLTDAERASLADWVALARRVRPLVATGRLVDGDAADDGIDVRGVVAAGREQESVVVAQTGSLGAAPGGCRSLTDLDPDRSYSVRIVTPSGIVQRPAQSPLRWAHHDTVLTGRQLGAVGLRPPVQYPQQATVIELLAV